MLDAVSCNAMLGSDLLRFVFEKSIVVALRARCEPNLIMTKVKIDQN